MTKKLVYLSILISIFFILSTIPVKSVWFLYKFQNESGRPVTDVKIRGYICATTTCETVIGSLWMGQILNTNEDAPENSIALEFPSTLQGAGYIFLQMHDEYKTRAQYPVTLTDAIYPGTSQSNPKETANSLITFRKQISCSSPISLSVVNNIRENLPVSVISGANLDATTASAIGFSSKPFVAAEFNYYFEVETTLRLKIYKYDSSTSKNIGSPIHEENVVERIYYDDTVDVAFTDWMPPAQTDQFSYYNITVESDVTDPKCSSKINQRASKIMRVWRDDPRNECYSLIDTDGLVFSPVDFANRIPQTGQEVTLTFRKLSNYANDYEPWDPLFTLTPQDTNINIRLTGAENTIITQALPKNPNENFSDVSVTWTPALSGTYTLEITADAATCPVITDTSSDPYIQTIMVFDPPKYDLKFTVKSGGNAVSGANVMIVNPPSEKFTSNLGVATYNLARGVYDYRIEKSPYLVG